MPFKSGIKGQGKYGIDIVESGMCALSHCDKTSRLKWNAVLRVLVEVHVCEYPLMLCYPISAQVYADANQPNA